MSLTIANVTELSRLCLAHASEEKWLIPGIIVGVPRICTDLGRKPGIRGADVLLSSDTRQPGESDTKNGLSLGKNANPSLD